MLFKKIQLLRGLINGEVAYTGPFFINVDITRRCNLACKGCQYHSSEIRKTLHKNYNLDFISLDLVEKLCSDLPNLDTHEVFLLGQGEPLLHPHIDKIISAFKQAGLRSFDLTMPEEINRMVTDAISDFFCDRRKWSSQSDSRRKSQGSHSLCRQCHDR